MLSTYGQQLAGGFAVILKRFYEDSIAHASYLVGCPGCGEALILDPNRKAEMYIEAARAEGLRITVIAETHIHADYVSGTRQLSEATGAAMYLSKEGGVDWQYEFPDMSRVRLVGEGDFFRIGGVRFDVLHTPGHTPEHLSLLITDEAAGADPIAIFSGDFVFVGDVGRPDLLENAAGLTGTMEPGARDLFRSIARFKTLPEFLTLWPAHGAGSACGKSLGGVPASSVGYEKRTNWALTTESEDAFVSEVLAGQPEPPPYFARMKKINREGPEVLPAIEVPHLGASLPPDSLLLDVRSNDAYLKSHPAAALHIPLGKSFLRWAGWLVSESDALVIVARSADQAHAAATQLSLIGMDRVLGWIVAESTASASTQSAFAPIVREHVILDVRSDAEWEEGHLPHARHIPLQHLQSRAKELQGERVAVHCGTGARAAIAASVLERACLEDVICIRSSYEELEAQMHAFASS